MNKMTLQYSHISEKEMSICPKMDIQYCKMAPEWWPRSCGFWNVLAVLLTVATCVVALFMLSSSTDSFRTRWHVVTAVEPRDAAAPLASAVGVVPVRCLAQPITPSLAWQLHLEERLPPWPGRRERSCRAVAREVIEQHQTDPPQPPENIPRELFDRFTMNGTMEVQKWFSYEKHGGAALEPHWTLARVKKAIDAATNECPSTGNYPGSCIDITAAIDRYPIRNQSGIVIGSVSPWLEGILLVHGARHITTVE